MIHLSSMPMILAAFSLQDLIPAGAITMIAAGLLLHYRKKRAQNFANSVTPHEQIDRNRQMRGVKGDLEDLMVEIEQLAKRFATQLDAKTFELEDLLQQADRRIAELKRLHQQDMPSTQGEGDANTLPTPVAPIEPEPIFPEDPLARSVYQLADEGMEPMQIAQQLEEHIGKIELILALRAT